MKNKITITSKNLSFLASTFPCNIQKFIFLFIIKIFYMYGDFTCICIGYQENSWCPWNQRKASEPLQLELSYKRLWATTLVLQIELGFSRRTASSLNHQAISQPHHIVIFLLKKTFFLYLLANHLFALFFSTSKTHNLGYHEGKK